MNIVILTEFGKGIGLGHLTRMSSLCDFCNEIGHQAKIIAYDVEKKENFWFVNDFFEKILHNVDVAVIDSYLCEFSVYESISNFVPKLIIIDDYNRMRYPKGVIINPNVYFESIDYSNQIFEHCGGVQFVILRKPFWEENYYKPIPNRILVSFGGSDYRKLSLKFGNLKSKFTDIRVVLPNPEDYNLFKLKFPQVSLLGKLNEKEFYNELKDADIVLSACGQTLHECYRLNKKTIGICIDKDQEYNKSYYTRCGFLYKSYFWNEENLFDLVSGDLFSLSQKSSIFTPKVDQSLAPRQNLERIVSKFH